MRCAHDVIVVGAGAFGAWAAEALRRAGKRVLLVDAWAPAHARSSSGGESRMTRAAYGADELYSRMARDSLEDWRQLSVEAGLPILHDAGVLFFFTGGEAYAEATIRCHQRLNLPTSRLDAGELRRRWPQVDWGGVAFGLFEPQFGVLMARRGIETLVARYVREGGEFRRAAVRPPLDAASCEFIETADGERLTADAYVFACGPWLARLFPRLLAARLFVTRQEVFFFAPPAGDRRFAAPALPGWCDFNHGDFHYGFPDLEGRGFKIAHDRHGPPVDPDAEDRLPTPAEIEDCRAYMARRFPALAKAPLSEARVCQYENSSNGDFLIDRHPDWPNVVLVGLGSGHGFKHGPEVGRYAARLILGGMPPEPRFTFSTKGALQARSVL